MYIGKPEECEEHVYNFLGIHLMPNSFFDHPILNPPYEYPTRHWELDESGQPTQKISERRRRAEFITPIPKPKKRKEPSTQLQMVFDGNRTEGEREIVGAAV
ncbi:MAG: hypothetical protein AB7P69_07095 [Candidatus Binatia bacterium]